MWIYEKKLEYPVKIHNCNPQAARIIISQLGGPDGETGAATRYLNQRYSMPDRKVMGILTDIGSEASEMVFFFRLQSFFMCASLTFCVYSNSVTPFAIVKLHLCGSIFK